MTLEERIERIEKKLELKKITLSEFFDTKRRKAIWCTTKEESDAIRRAFHNFGKKWSAGQSYLKEDYWKSNTKQMYYLNSNTWQNSTPSHTCDVYEFDDVELDIKELKFAKGDRVILASYDDDYMDCGLRGKEGRLKGTIVCVREYDYSVEFDDDFGGHVCNGLTKKGHGQFVQAKDLELLKEEKNHFRVGDRVVLTGYVYPYAIELAGKLGMQGVIKHDTNTDVYAVEFDKKFSGGHTCGGRTRKGRGHYINAEHLKLANKTLKIGDRVIFRDRLKSNINGEIGTIIGVDTSDENLWLVEFDKDSPMLHNGMPEFYTLRKPHSDTCCWWCRDIQLSVVKTETFSKKDKEILKSLSSVFTWIAKDEDGEVNVFEFEPVKSGTIWYEFLGEYSANLVTLFGKDAFANLSSEKAIDFRKLI